MRAALVTAQAGPAAMPTLPNTNATVYNASATCATVPKTAQMVPDMTDFLAGLQVSHFTPPCIAQRMQTRRHSWLILKRVAYYHCLCTAFMWLCITIQLSIAGTPQVIMCSQQRSNSCPGSRITRPLCCHAVHISRSVPSLRHQHSLSSVSSILSPEASHQCCAGHWPGHQAQ